MGQVPKLRFPGFNEPWEHRKLSEVTDVRDGTHNSPKYYDDGYPLVTSKNVKDGYVNYDDIQYINKGDYNEINQRSKVDKNDILMGMIGTIGNIALVRENPTFAIKNVALIKDTNNINYKFLYHCLESSYIKNQLISGINGGTQKFISLNKIRNIDMPFTVALEQQQIGVFFENLDDLIILHQCNLDDIKSLKQSMLQKMFPKNGEDKPEIRFPGFTEPWEQRKLGEISEIVGGGTPSTSIAEYWDGDIDWYAPAEIGEQIYVNSSKKKITKAGLEDSSAKILPIGTILFTSRAGIGNTAILAKNGATNQGFQSIIPIQNVLDTYFLFSMTNQLKRYGEITGAGSTFVEVSGKQMAKMELMLPSYNEQQQIGAFFKNLDDLITLHQRKLDDLKQLKQALLQQMFI